MANNDKIDIVFKATSDKKSAEKTGEELVNTAQNAVDKKGGIKLDLKLAKRPIKGLEKEQKEIINMWEKVSKKGGLLSVPKKDATEFLDIYTKFSRLIGQSRKSNSVAYKEIKKVLGKEVQNYRNIYSDKNIKRAQARWADESNTRRILRKQRIQNLKSDTHYFRTLRRGGGSGELRQYGAKTKMGTRSPNMDSTYYGLETVHPKTGRKDKPILRLNDKVGTYFGKNSLMKRSTRNRKII